MKNSTGEKNINALTHITKVGGLVSLGTVLFVLSDPVMHFSLQRTAADH